MATSRLLSFPPIAVTVLILLVSFPFLFAFSLEDTGSTLYLDSIPYYIPATPFTTIDPASLGDYHAKKSSSGLLPVTVVSVQKNKFGVKELDNVVSDFAKDDVWGEGFLGGELQNITKTLVFLLDFDFYAWQIPDMGFLSAQRCDIDLILISSFSIRAIVLKQ